MYHINKRATLLFGAIIFFLTTIGLCAYDVNLKGGSEIKQAAEIISNLTSLHSVKLLFLILLGFFVALQGIRMLSNGLSQVINEQNAHKKGLLLGLMGIIFFGSGLAVIFKDELFARFKPKKRTNVTISNVVRSDAECFTVSEKQNT